MSTATATAAYIMEHPREGLRLERKIDPDAWVKKYLAPYLFPGARVLDAGCGPGTILRAMAEWERTAYGSGVDGRLLVTFPTKGDWLRGAVWSDPALPELVEGQALASRLSDRREQVAMLLEREVGPVLQNSTRGDALVPNVGKYGRFLAEWGTIYERFGVPGDIGLAQGILESGLSATSSLSRIRFTLSCASRPMAGMFSACSVCLSTRPVTRRPLFSWKRRTASSRPSE